MLSLCLILQAGCAAFDNSKTPSPRAKLSSTINRQTNSDDPDVEVAQKMGEVPPGTNIFIAIGDCRKGGSACSLLPKMTEAFAQRGTGNFLIGPLPAYFQPDINKLVKDPGYKKQFVMKLSCIPFRGNPENLEERQELAERFASAILKAHSGKDPMQVIAVGANHENYECLLKYFIEDGMAPEDAKKLTAILKEHDDYVLNIVDRLKKMNLADNSTSLLSQLMSEEHLHKELINNKIEKLIFAMKRGAYTPTSLARTLKEGLEESRHSIAPEVASFLFKAQKEGKSVCGLFDDGMFSKLNSEALFKYLAGKTYPHVVITSNFDGITLQANGVSLASKNEPDGRISFIYGKTRFADNANLPSPGPR